MTGSILLSCYHDIFLYLFYGSEIVLKMCLVISFTKIANIMDLL